MRLIEGERLDELVNAPDQEIYHWTNAEYLRRILHDGHLKAGASTHKINGQTFEGVSMSRNKFFDITHTYAVSGIKAWRLGFNLQRLKSDHRVIPIRDEYLRNVPRQGQGAKPDLFGSKYDLKTPATSSDEMEEFVIGDIYPIWHYLTSIAVEDRHIDVDYTPDETENWDYEEFDNGVGGMSQEDQEMLFDLLAGSVFGKAGFKKAFGKDARHAVRVPETVPFLVIDRESHQILPAREVFGPRIQRAHQAKIPEKPDYEATGDWPVSAMSYNRNDRNQVFNQKTRTVHDPELEEGRFDDENTYQYGAQKTAEDYTRMVWYHGGEDDFDTFEGGRGRYKGLWFAENPKLTGYYGPNQFKVRLHIKNPLIVSEEEYIAGKPNGPTSWLAKAESEGHDAVIIQDIIDGDTESTVCGVADPSIIEILDKDIYQDEIDEEVKFPLAKDVLSRARGSYGALLCVMNPMDFLRLTTVSEVDREHILHKDEFAPSVAAFKSGEHPKYNKNQYGIPYLNVDYESGQVVGHEGRHRAAMMVREGGTKFPCVLYFRSAMEFEVTYSREPISIENGEVVYGRGEYHEQIFKSQEEAEAFIDNLKAENKNIESDVYNSDIKNRALGGSTMKGSPRSIPSEWKYDAWKPEDMPNQLIGQFNSSVVVPKSDMKVGVVKGYGHYK